MEKNRIMTERDLYYRKKYIKEKRAAIKRRKLRLVGLIFFVLLLLSVTTIHTAAAAKGEVSVLERDKYYTSIKIDAGATLWDIAEEYMTEEYASVEDYIEEVKEINHMESDMIYTDAYLCIPYYSSEEIK